MCRLCAVLSDEAVLLADFLLRPRMSLVRQSYAAQERRALPAGVLPTMAYQQPFLNADGFGVGWYKPDTAMHGGEPGELDQPCVFTSLKPAWNDPNLRNLSLEVRSPLVLAHIRAAGPSLPVSESCCHPFKAGRLLFAHNGMVGDYSRVRRELLQGLTEFSFAIAVKHACIDSAVAFAIFLSELNCNSEEDCLKNWEADEICGAMARTINRIVTAVGGRDESLLNFVACDGHRIVACRYATAPSAGGLHDGAEEEQPLGATLYLSSGSRWVASPDDPESYRMQKGSDIKCATAILSSEPLTAIREEWLPIAPNTLVVCGMRRGHCSAIDILMFPVEAQPSTCLSALLGIEASASTMEGTDSPRAKKLSDAAEILTPQATSTYVDSDKNDVWTYLTGSSQDVNCVTSLFDGRVVVSGSMDGNLRFYHVDSGQILAKRKHSSQSGAVLALLPILGPSEPWSGPNSPTETPRATAALQGGSDVLIPLDNGKEEALRQVSSTTSNRSCSPDPAARLDPDDHKYLLLSTANNELRVWNVGACNSWSPGDSIEVPCLLCFRFVPNQGQLLALAGNLDHLVLGFQSTRLFRLKLAEGWKDLLTCKHRSRSTRYFTCNVNFQPNAAQQQLINKCNSRDLASPPDVMKDQPGTACSQSQQATSFQVPGIHGMTVQAKATIKFCHHSLLEPMHGIGSGHLGYVRCIAYDSRTGLVASGGGDGRIIFWGRQGQVAHFAHGGPVLAMATKGWAGQVFSADARGRIRVWDCTSVQHGSRQVLSAPARGSASGSPSASAILALCLVDSHVDEGLLLAGGGDGIISIWNLGKSTLVREVSCGVSCVASLSLLEVDQAIKQQGQRYQQWLIRIACGGCSSGCVALGDLAVVARQEGGDDDDDDEQLVSANSSMVCEPSNRQGSLTVGTGTARDVSEYRRMLVLLRELLAIPTLSGNPKFTTQMQKGTIWVAQHFEQLLGSTVRVSGNCVIARCGWDEHKPLVAMYAHYDIVDPGSGWDSDPYTLTAKDGFLYGRGTADNKGPLLAQIFAIRKILRGGVPLHPKARVSSIREDGEFIMRVDDEVWECPLPKKKTGIFTNRTKRCSTSINVADNSVNVLLIADGGEEVGDVSSVQRALREAKEDGWMSQGVAGLLVSNSSWIDDERPCLVYGMRGVVDVEVTVVGADRPLHSGVHGGLVVEPMFDLMALCSTLVDSSAMPCVPGFSTAVRKLSEEDKSHLLEAARTVDLPQLRQRLGQDQNEATPKWLRDHSGSHFDALRRTWCMPALSITDVVRGHDTQGGRHIDNKASCIVSARTTPCMTQEGVTESLNRHLRHEFEKRRSPNRLSVKTITSCDWWEAKTNSVIYKAARTGMAQAWGIDEQNVLAVREGGTMAILPALEAELGCSSVQMALSQASSSLHLANERIASQTLARAVDAIAATLVEVGELLSEGQPAK